MALVWFSIVTAVAGLAIGLRFKVSALLVSAWILTLCACLAMSVYDWPYSAFVLRLMLLLAILQLSYLLGVWLTLYKSQPASLKHPGSTE